ncbi:MAG: hypothetical protein ABJK59_12335 [Erythrobacter sp.]|uniref:hypothetical protein n=1 Tax=Erythrobacter sp. TaxID=1042 RepID=UPI003298C1CE
MASHAENNFEASFDKTIRVAPRLPLSLPGTFISTMGNPSCIVTNLSRTGVLIAIREPLQAGSVGYLRCGPIDHFVIVKRKGVGLNAVVFELPVSDAFVARVRDYKNSFAEKELNDMRLTAQEWAGAELS